MDAWGCKNGMSVPLGAGSRLILAIWVHPRMALLACCALFEPMNMLLVKEDHEMHRLGKVNLLSLVIIKPSWAHLSPPWAAAQQLEVELSQVRFSLSPARPRSCAWGQHMYGCTLHPGDKRTML